ncbi:MULTISPECIES: hypothetical protein [Hyphomicrobiales]|jgi:hypothetical protein|uniref:hypothetical protein n=1 Tax=Hyphomicrobiales TaxID=356 RepID=UPI000362A7BC|nr:MULTISPECIES: hypothetical protein [Phyllobacteriaceae]MCX8568117.1 hypothetical protein [Aminobacter sp. MET-1]
MAATDISSAPNSAAATANGTKLRLGPSTALVIGSMVGSRVFSLPQNRTAGAGPLAIVIGWAITAIGMLAAMEFARATGRPGAIGRIEDAAAIVVVTKDTVAPDNPY